MVLCGVVMQQFGGGQLWTWSRPELMVQRRANRVNKAPIECTQSKWTDATDPTPSGPPRLVQARAWNPMMGNRLIIVAVHT